MSNPTYAEVTDEATTALSDVQTALPGVLDVVQRPESPPFPCDENLSGGTRRGYFYTASWEFHLEGRSALPEVLANLRSSLGSGWTTEDIGIPDDETSIHIRKVRPEVSVAVFARFEDGTPIVFATATSRCGVIAD